MPGLLVTGAMVFCGYGARFGLRLAHEAFVIRIVLVPFLFFTLQYPSVADTERGVHLAVVLSAHVSKQH